MDKKKVYFCGEELVVDKKVKVIEFTEENLEQAAQDSVVYLQCPVCEDEITVEPDARQCYCDCSPGTKFKIINPYF